MYSYSLIPDIPPVRASTSYELAEAAYPRGIFHTEGGAQRVLLWPRRFVHHKSLVIRNEPSLHTDKTHTRNLVQSADVSINNLIFTGPDPVVVVPLFDGTQFVFQRMPLTIIDKARVNDDNFLLNGIVVLANIATNKVEAVLFLVRFSAQDRPELACLINTYFASLGGALSPCLPLGVYAGFILCT
jgi:hypothetical protein